MNYIKTAILLVALSALLIACGHLVGGINGAMTAFVFSLFINVISFWFSDKIVLAMYRAQPLKESEAPEVYTIVRGLAREAALPVPKIYITEMDAPNAFATGRSPGNGVVCITSGLLKILDRDEIKGVIAHEMAHIKNRDTLVMTVTATIASAVMMLANMTRWAMMFGGYGGRDNRGKGGGNAVAMLVMVILAPIAALLIQLAISRSREYGADAAGARFAHTGTGLSRALQKLNQAKRYAALPSSPQTAHLFIISPLRGDFIANLFSTHPPVEKRIERLKRIG